MIIAIPTNKKNMSALVCPSFGRSQYYMIFDTVTKKKHFINNPAFESSDGAGIKAAQQLIDEGVKIIITSRYGENASQLLLASGIKVYKNIDGSLYENIQVFLNDQLTFLADIHPGFSKNEE